MTAVRKARVTITLNRELLRAVDRDAKARQQPRSAIIEERLQQSELDRQIREYYAGESEPASIPWAEQGADALARLNALDPWPEAAPKRKPRKAK